MELRTRLLKKTAAQLVLLLTLLFYILILFTIYKNQSAGTGAHGGTDFSVLTVVLGGIFFAFLLGFAIVRPALTVLTGSRYRGMEYVERYFSDAELDALLSGESFRLAGGGLFESERWILIDKIFIPKNMIADWHYTAGPPRRNDGSGIRGEVVELLLTDGRIYTLAGNKRCSASACNAGLLRTVRPLRPDLLRNSDPAQLRAARRSLKQEFLADLESDRRFLFDRPVPSPLRSAVNTPSCQIPYTA